MSLLQKIERQLYDVNISDAERERLEQAYMELLKKQAEVICK